MTFPPPPRSLRELYMTLPEPTRSEMLARIQYHWPSNARPDQIVPDNVTVHAILAGRGFGKTRSGAEWIREKAKEPNLRLLLVARTAADLREVMIEGESGILNVTPHAERPMYTPATRRLSWPSGTQAFCTSADEPHSVRGVQAHFSWCEEAPGWREGNAEDALASVLMATRLGLHPQTLITGTPSSGYVSRWLQKSIAEGRKDLSIVHGSTMDNAYALHPDFVGRLSTLYDGTTQKITEIEGLFPVE